MNSLDAGLLLDRWTTPDPEPMPPPPRPPTGARVALRGVGKAFGGRTVLDGIDLDIRPGSFVSVIGRSGEGGWTIPRATR